MLAVGNFSVTVLLVLSSVDCVYHRLVTINILADGGECNRGRVALCSVAMTSHFLVRVRLILLPTSQSLSSLISRPTNLKCKYSN